MKCVALLRRKTAEAAIDPIVMTLEECVSGVDCQGHVWMDSHGEQQLAGCLAADLTEPAGRITFCMVIPVQPGLDGACQGYLGALQPGGSANYCCTIAKM